jgi:hypothetical protein
MTPDKDRVRLEHMRAAAREAMDLIRGKDRAALRAAGRAVQLAPEWADARDLTRRLRR